MHLVTMLAVLIDRSTTGVGQWAVQLSHAGRVKIRHSPQDRPSRGEYPTSSVVAAFRGLGQAGQVRGQRGRGVGGQQAPPGVRGGRAMWREGARVALVLAALHDNQKPFLQCCPACEQAPSPRRLIRWKSKHLLPPAIFLRCERGHRARSSAHAPGVHPPHHPSLSVQEPTQETPACMYRIQVYPMCHLQV